MLHQKQTFLTITVHIMFSKKQKTSNLSVLAARKFPPAALVPSAFTYIQRYACQVSW